MTAAVLRRAGEPITFEERGVPDPGPGQVRIRVEACGICFSDLQLQQGFFDFATLPIVPGHEVVGRVDAVAPDVSTWAPGDRVGVPWIWSACGVCDACVAADEPGCARRQICGVTVDGGFAPYLVAPAAFVTRVPAELPALEAAPLFGAGLAVYAALQAAEVRAGMTVAVHGIGGLGHLGLQVANALDTQVVAMTRGTGKHDLARELGALEVIDAAEDDPAAALRDLGGADVILTTVPGGRTIGPLLSGLKQRGALVVVGNSAEAFPIAPRTIVGGRLRVIGSSAGSRRQLREVLDLAARHAIRPMVESCRLAEVPRMFERLARHEVRFRAVIEFP
jgi:D-arabinose 1-dehydrogenase-like Zn-dependent alcohol dehydrogenase